MEKLSVNRLSLSIVNELMKNAELYRVKVEELECGAKVIDTGLEVPGSYSAGLKLTEICLGGLGSAQLSCITYSPDFALPSIIVSTDHPALALLGCQLAGWMIKHEDFFAPSSGPARALALKPKKVFEKLGYKDESDVAVVVMEVTKKPGNEVAEEVAKTCGIDAKNLYILLTNTSSIVGSVQVAGRVAETGLYRLEYLGLDPLKVDHAIGVAPIMPIHPDYRISTAREEDSLLYGGIGFYVVDEEDSKLEDLVRRAPSITWKDYGRLSYEALKEVDFDWSKLDPSFFTIAHISILNKRSGRIFSGGRINSDMLKKSLSFVAG